LSNIYNISKPIGILGIGSFGTVLANLIAERHSVIMYARKQSTVDNINIHKKHREIEILPNITATTDLSLLAGHCDIIFPVLPSYAFRNVIKELSNFLTSNHILIHGAKGFDVKIDFSKGPVEIRPKDICTMSEVILEETPVHRVGCISGPNLAKEIAQRQPAGTVLASKFKEVLTIGTDILQCDRFQIYRSNDIRGIELAGVFKNYIAIAAGASAALGYGENVKALLITKGISEMIAIGKTLGVEPKSFLGLAGIGDLVATCSSPLSRNYSVGYRLAKGETIEQIIATMTEAAEGINTVKVIKYLSDTMHIQAPLVGIIYKIMYEGFSLEQGIKLLMRLNAGQDVSFY
jgi:glycerol-3-phosphate dehydrogenase (NAD(P)+)